MQFNKLSLAAFAALALVACKKEDPAPTPPAPAPSTQGSVRLSLEFTKGMMPFDFNAAHTDGAGNTIRLTTLKFYLSGAHLMDDGMATVAEFNSTYMLVDAAATSNMFTLGNVNAGHIHELQITMGLDSVTNYADPLNAAFPLNIPGMHWSWNPTAGYKFLNLEGYVDVNNNGVLDTGIDTPFQYHCAQNLSQGVAAPVLRHDDVHVHADLVAGGTLTIETKVDVIALLNGVDLLATPVAMGNGAGNQLLMNNLVTAFDGH